MKVIGTAGHIDHGKSTLVRCLTGIDPDRLAEEKRRGMTIDLGFAWLTLPSGAEVSIVDVPGHERFIKNMLAGAGGIDIALLVIAADEGVMPQTREHLDILDLLSVRDGVVALSKSDLIDEGFQALVEEDVKAVLRGTSLEGASVVPVSAITGSGIDELKLALDRVVAAHRNQQRGVTPYLPIDRVFTVAGFGTVVTGTLHNASMEVGEDVDIAPTGLSARIRGLQSHQQQIQLASPGSRIAVNLAGVPRDHIARGDMLVPAGRGSAVRRFDGSIRVAASAPFPLSHNTEVSLHIGAAECIGMLSVLGETQIQPGSSGWVQMRCRQPIAAIPGQHFILRLPSPARTVAGGEVVEVAPHHRRLDRSAVERLAMLTSEEEEAAVVAAVGGRRRRSPDRIAELLGLPPERARALLSDAVSKGRLVRLADSYTTPAIWDETVRLVLAALHDFHQSHPLKDGMSREELRRRLGWTVPEWNEAIIRMVQAGAIRMDGSVMAAASHQGGTSSRMAEADRVIAVLARGAAAPPSGRDLMAESGADIALLEALRAEGRIVRVSDGLYYERGVYDDLVCRVIRMIRQDGAVSVAGVRDSLATSRKYALALLEHLDSERVTQRRGDLRTAGSRAPACV